MNHRLTHTLVGIVAAGLVVATLAFGFVVTAYSRAGGPRPAARSAIPPITHPVNESMADCLRCHKVGQGGMPPSHATYGAGTCLTCHRVAQTSLLAPGEAVPTTQPASTSLPESAATAGATSAPTVAAQATAGPVPHPIVAPYASCSGCHAIGGNLSMPHDHAGYTNEVCTNCHDGPAAGAGGGVGPPVPHEVTGPYANCESCHAPGNGNLAVPQNHAGFTKATCTNCHEAS